MVYLDTSVLVAAFTNEEKTDSALAYLEQESEAMTSEWALTEVASALMIKVRRKELSRADETQAWKQFLAWAAFSGAIRAIPAGCFEKAATLLRGSSGLRAGDSLHLSAALSLGATRLASFDLTLTKSARALGLGTAKI
ncbi:MAG: PIN domain-containing protein [Betaproteobacteria bacterium]|nr:PIN domain-containing protein [Betaproteobacteria bacterium]NBT76189.1 PIN domain-containing protein [Betaproteobacteria bacterium]